VLSFRKVRQVLWSYRQALKASRRLGRAEKLRKASRPQDALTVAREGLAFLHHPDVIRDSPPEMSALVCLTITVEQLAHELQQPGADERDLRDAYANLAELRTSTSPKESLRRMRAAWLPYLHRRLRMEGNPPE
jgi:hypothetical protein